MQNIPRMEGTPDPKRISGQNKEEEIDPEKFKKVMKIDETDDTQKRHKRQKAEEDLESDEEDQADANQEVAPGFSLLMDESELRDSLYSPKSSSQTVSSSDEPTTGPPGTSPFNVMSKNLDQNSQVSNISNGITVSNDSDPSLSKNEEKKTSLPLDQKTKLKLAQKQTKKQLTQALKVAKEQEQSSTQTFASPNSLNTHQKETPLFTQKDVEQQKEQEVSEQMQNFAPEKRRIETPIAPSDTHWIDLEKKKKTLQEAELKKNQQNHEEEKKEKEEQNAPPLTDFSSHLLSDSIVEAQPPSYSTLASHIYDLYERLVGLVTVQQYSDRTKTTVTLNMPGSIFHNAEIVLEKYATALNTFNIQLLGSPQAVEVFDANIDDLIAAFQDHQHSFEVHIKRPYLQEKYRYLIQKPTSTQEGNKQGDGEKEDS